MKTLKTAAAAFALVMAAGVTAQTFAQKSEEVIKPAPKVKTAARKTGEATQTGTRNTGGGVTRLARKAGGNGPDTSKNVPPKVKTAARKTGGAVKTGARNIGGGIKRLVRKAGG